MENIIVIVSIYVTVMATKQFKLVTQINYIST